MTITLLPNLSSVALLGAVLVVGSTSGAVGGAMITGDDIAAGAITTQAVQDDALGVDDDLSHVAGQSLQGPKGPKGPKGPRGERGQAGVDGANGVSGIEWSWRYVAVAAGEPAQVRTSCPDGKVATGGTAWWSGSHDPVQVFIPPSLTSGTAYSLGVEAADILNIRLICAYAG